MRLILLATSVICCELLVVLLALSYSFYEVYALSPSFPHQLISDRIDDWNFQEPPSYYSNRAAIMSDCESDEFLPPDISGIGYVSDGKTLNASLWLSAPFKDPSSDFLDNLYIRIYNYTENVTLEEQLNRRIDFLNHTYEGFKIFQFDTKTTIAGHTGYLLVYTYSDTINSTLLKDMEVGTIIDGKVYVLNYTADAEGYKKNLAQVQRVIESFKVNEHNFTISQSENRTSDFVEYQNTTYGIEIRYPSNWDALDHLLDSGNDFKDVVLFIIEPISLQKVYKMHTESFLDFNRIYYFKPSMGCKVS
jgi:hypothetical protein